MATASTCGHAHDVVQMLKANGLIDAVANAKPILPPETQGRFNVTPSGKTPALAAKMIACVVASDAGATMQCRSAGPSSFP
jgi:hypothetical protein